MVEHERVYGRKNCTCPTYYIPPMTPDKGWIALRGVMLDGEIRYDVVGKPIYRSEEFERNRLIGKLQELCSATGAPAPTAKENA